MRDQGRELTRGDLAPDARAQADDHDLQRDVAEARPERHPLALDRGLDVETVTIKSDPLVEHGIIMSSDDGLYLHGVVDTAGLHLQNDTITLAIDTTVASFPINFTVSVSMTHPLILPPVDGKMEWTSVAEGTATVPILGIPITATITGDMRYRTVLSDSKKITYNNEE